MFHPKIINNCRAGPYFAYYGGLATPLTVKKRRYVRSRYPQAEHRLGCTLFTGSCGAGACRGLRRLPMIDEDLPGAMPSKDVVDAVQALRRIAGS